MKTLKKTLCLVLALSISLGIGNFAFASKAENFSDVANVEHKYYQAVETLVALGIIKGTGENQLSPKAIYTREEAAKIAACLALGVETAEIIGGTLPGEDPFSDVSKDRWSAGYIAYCANNNILNGVGDGNFDPEGKLTGYAWAKMLLCVLGYGQKGEFVGTNWAIAVARLGINRGIYNGDETLASDNSITREQAILMAFNAIFVNRVAINGNTGQYIGDDYFGEGGGGLENGTVNGALVDAKGYYGTIAKNIFHIERITDATVMANETASLVDGNKDIAAVNVYGTIENKYAGKTVFRYTVKINQEETRSTDEKFIWQSGIEDLGETRNLVVSSDSDINGVRQILSCVDTGKNIVSIKENGETIVAYEDNETNELQKIEASAYYVNYDAVDETGFNTVITIKKTVKLGDSIRYIDNNSDGINEFALALCYELKRMDTDGDDEPDTIMVGVNTDGIDHFVPAEKVRAAAVLRDYYNGTITLSNNKPYKWSDINNSTELSNAFDTLTEKIEYIFYLDVYGNIRAYEYPEVKASDYILVTGLYNKEVYSLVTTENGGPFRQKVELYTVESAEVVNTKGKILEYPAKFESRYLGWQNGEIQDVVGTESVRNWFGSEAAKEGEATGSGNHLKGIGRNQDPDKNSWTNLAAYKLREDVITLDIAWEWHAAQSAEYLKYDDQYVGIINLKTENDIYSGQTSFDYTDQKFYHFGSFSGGNDDGYISLGSDTRVYFVIDDDVEHEGIDEIFIKTGYSSIPDITKSSIHSMYALCTDEYGETKSRGYYKAEILVIELYENPFVEPSARVIYNLSNITKKNDGTAAINYIDTDGIVRNYNVEWDNLYFNGKQITYIEPLTWNLMTTTVIEKSDGTRETKVDVYPIIKDDEKKTNFIGSCVVNHILDSYVDITMDDGNAYAVDLPEVGSYKVLKIKENSVLIDGKEYITYTAEESTLEPGTQYLCLRDKDTGGNPFLCFINVSDINKNSAAG